MSHTEDPVLISKAVRNTPTRPKHMVLWLLGTTIAWSACFVACGIFSAFQPTAAERVGALVGLTLAVAVFAQHRIRQYRVLGTSLESILAVEGFSLFLRSFRKDREFVWHSFVPEWFYWGSPTAKGSKTFEDLIWKEFERSVGPLVALGDPRDRMPHLGARRLYCASSSWQSTIQALVSPARCVLILASASAGLDWELEHLRLHCRPDRLFVLTAPRVVFWHANFGRRSKVRDEWSTVVSSFNAAGLQLPLNYPGDGSVTAFRSITDPYVIATRCRARTMAHAIAAALEKP